jgi:hypothetical protein
MGDEVLVEHPPHVELVRRLEPVVAQVLVDNAIERKLWPGHTILAAVDLVLRAKNVIQPPAAICVIVNGLVAGSKTVPYPLTN